MKLHELLRSYRDKELTQEMISAISSQVDEIKARATDKLQTEIKELKTSFEKNNQELKTFKAEKQEGALKEAFVKSGGNPEKYESFKKVAKVEDINKFDYKATFKEFPSLQGAKKETPPPPGEEGGQAKGIFSQITNTSGVPTETKEPTVKVYG